MATKFTRQYPKDFTEQEFTQLGSTINNLEGWVFLNDHWVYRFTLDVFKSKGGRYTCDLCAYLRDGTFSRVTYPNIFYNYQEMIEYLNNNAYGVSKQDWKSHVVKGEVHVG